MACAGVMTAPVGESARKSSSPPVRTRRLVTANGSIWRRERCGSVIFLDNQAQGPSDPGELDPAGTELTEQLATAWLHTAAERASDTRDRAEATRRLAELTDEPDDAQGPRAVIRPAMNGLTRLRWFAPMGLGLAGRFVYHALTQVNRYLTDDTIRRDAQDLVLAHIGPNPPRDGALTRIRRRI
jgi:hypothetical protein